MGQSLMRHRYIQILIVSAGTAVASEFKINPFAGDIFRIGLGSSAFLLFLLLWRHLPYALTGVATGIFVLLYRSIVDLASGSGLGLQEILFRHCSAAVYYMVFALGMQLIKSRLDTFHPLVLGAVAAFIDLLSNEMELLTRFIVPGTSTFRLNEWSFLMAIAMLRTYFTTGIYSSISVSRMRIIQREQKRRIEQMLGFGSGLYGEVFYLRKSIGTLENMTLSSYELYRGLKDEEHPRSRRVLDITQQIHEVKKDSQRILAGLLKLVDRETTGDMPLSELLRFTIKSNVKYADMLGKKISFSQHLASDYATAHYIPLLTLLNNLTANAVEAIKSHGTVSLNVYEQGGLTVLSVTDSGSGIRERDRELLFEPGFTTKFDEEGASATGIGLSHVRDIVEAFEGEITVGSAPYTGGALFQIRIPTVKLRKEE